MQLGLFGGRGPGKRNKNHFLSIKKTKTSGLGEIPSPKPHLLVLNHPILRFFRSSWKNGMKSSPPGVSLNRAISEEESLLRSLQELGAFFHAS